MAISDIQPSCANLELGWATMDRILRRHDCQKLLMAILDTHVRMCIRVHERIECIKCIPGGGGGGGGGGGLCGSTCCRGGRSPRIPGGRSSPGGSKGAMLGWASRGCCCRACLKGQSSVLHFPSYLVRVIAWLLWYAQGMFTGTMSHPARRA